MMKKITKKMTLVVCTLMGVLLLAGCGKKQADAPVVTDISAEADTTPTEEMVYLAEPAEYSSFVEALPLAPDFAKDAVAALEAYMAADFAELSAGRWYLANSENYLLVDEDGSLRVVNPVENSSKLVDVKLFKSDNDKLVLVGFKGIDNCRMPVTVTIMDDGAILKEEEADIDSIDTIGLDEKAEIILRSQYLTLVANETTLKFYRFGEEVSGGFEMPEKVSGAYSSMFLDKEGTLYLTLVSTNKENPWVQLAKVDEEVKSITDKTFTSEVGVFPIYTKMVDGEEKEFSIVMDQDTYDAYVYTMYPNVSGSDLEPNVSFEIVDPNNYVMPETSEDTEATTDEEPTVSDDTEAVG